MTDFQKAFAWTAIPICALSIISTAGALGRGGFYIYFFWYGAAAAAALAILAAIGFVRADKRGTASGILAGMGVGVLALAVTCFANLATFIG